MIEISFLLPSTVVQMASVRHTKRALRATSTWASDDELTAVVQQRVKMRPDTRELVNDCAAARHGRSQRRLAWQRRACGGQGVKSCHIPPLPQDRS